MRHRSTFSSACAAILLVACGGADGSAPVDADNSAPVDAAPGPDARATIAVRGVAQTVQGTSIGPLAGATIEAFNVTGGAALASAVSAADGSYSLTLTTNGAPLDGYLKGTSAGRLATYLYPPRPLATDTNGALVLLINQATLDLLGTFTGVSQDHAKGFIGVRVQDAAGTAIAGATITISPMGTARVIYAANSLPSSTATATDASGAAFIANTNVGNVTIGAATGATTFHAHTVNARAGALTTTAIEP